MGISLEKTESTAPAHAMKEEVAEALRADLFKPAREGSSPSPENPDPNRTRGDGDNKPKPKSGPDYLEGSMQERAGAPGRQGEAPPEGRNKPDKPKSEKSEESSESITFTNPYPV